MLNPLVETSPAHFTTDQQRAFLNRRLKASLASKLDLRPNYMDLSCLKGMAAGARSLVLQAVVVSLIFMHQQFYELLQEVFFNKSCCCKLM